MDEMLQAQKQLGRTLERVSISEDRQLANAVRERGEAFANLFFSTMRMTRMLDINNESFIRPVQELRKLLIWLLQNLGVIHLVTVEDQIYINDIARVLPPQQLVPFRKIAAADWYRDEFKTTARFRRPTGMMWGVVTQSIVGLDWIELIARGLVLATILAWLHQKYLRNSHSFFYTLFYLWLGAKIYNCYRDTTLAPLVLVLYEVLPIFFAVKVLGVVLRRGTRPSVSSVSREVGTPAGGESAAR